MRDDARIDKLYDALLVAVTSDMNAKALNIESGVWLLHAGHCLERFADRATNIAERVIYVDTGELAIIDRSYDAHGGK